MIVSIAGLSFSRPLFWLLATALTAWCGYQAAQWDGEQARAYTEAIQVATGSGQIGWQRPHETSIDIGVFTQWAEAYFPGQDDFADFLYQRFPPIPGDGSTEAWLPPSR